MAQQRQQARPARPSSAGASKARAGPAAPARKARSGPAAPAGEASAGPAASAASEARSGSEPCQVTKHPSQNQAPIGAKPLAKAKPPIVIKRQRATVVDRPTDLSLLKRDREVLPEAVSFGRPPVALQRLHAHPDRFKRQR